jgi:spermidine synthase
MLYEVVWLRLAMESFGVTTALTSIVLSVFMAGLGLGAWASGRVLRQCQGGLRMSVLIYAAIEAVIGLSALLVPIELYWGRILTERLALASSLWFYVLSGLCIAVALLPWCACMGATLPVGMQALRSSHAESERSFSYLYVANLSGALLGTLVPLFLIELRGFRGTLEIGAVLNFSLALTATLLAFRSHSEMGPAQAKREVEPLLQPLESSRAPQHNILVLLFGTGLTCMGMEVVWIRQFTPFVGTMVYSFALILGVYLCATTVGARIYRVWSENHSHEPSWVWVLLGFCGLLPLLTTNPLLHWWPQAQGSYAEPALGPLLRLFIGIGPFSAMLGFVTPMLVDRWSRGNADRAGTAYAINILGCILGPLLSGFLLLPRMNEQFALFLLVLPWFGIGLSATFERRRQAAIPVWSYAIALAAVPLMVSSHSYEDLYPVRQVLRDHTATVVAARSAYGKHLFVNGVGITSMTPITKMMAHLPMASLDRPPQNALVICFGMGTTFRSLLSWSVPVTAVELVPSVPRVFGFFHEDGPALLQSAHAHVVIDDGRRYLERTTEQYDVITIDPPPPVPAAGSSLLYARELYVIARKRLRPGGILAQWFPDEKNAIVLASVSRAIREVFPFVRAFPSVDGSGVHFLASNQPISLRTPEELVLRMPRTATADLVEWQKQKDPADSFASVVEHELSVDTLITSVPDAPTLDDDHPINEFFLLRCMNLLQRDSSRMGCAISQANTTQ